MKFSSIIAATLACACANALAAGAIEVPENNQLALDAPVEASALTMRNGSSIVASPDPVTMTWRSEDGVSYFLFDEYLATSLGSDADDAGLTVEFRSPVQFNGAQDGGADNSVRIWAKLTGGCADAPCPVRFTKADASWNHARAYLLNPDNDFVGPIEIRGLAGQPECSLTVCLGQDEVAAVDSMLGNAANEITLSYYPQYWVQDANVQIEEEYTKTRLFLSDIGDNGLRRKVHGSGVIAGKKAVASDYSDCPLVLGDGFTSDPSVFSRDTQRSIYGFQDISGTSVAFHPNATLVFDVDAQEGSLKYDVINFMTSSAFNLTGSIVVNETAELPVGTVFPVMTVAASAGSCAANPHAITPGWACSVVESDGGWTIQLVKEFMAPIIRAHEVNELGPTSVVLVANVLSLGSAEEGKVAFCYGPTDGGSDPTAWAVTITGETVTAKGVYSAKVAGLSFGDYVFRPAFIVNGAPIMAEESLAFHTVPDSTPSSFTWRAIEDDWDAEVWERTTLDYARLRPGCSGDTLRFELGGYWNSEGIVYGSNAIVRMTHDVTFGNIEVTGGFGHELRFLPTEGGVLTLDNGGSESLIHMFGPLGTLAFGSPDIATSLVLANPLQFFRESNDDGSYMFYSKVTGGSASKPCGITFRMGSDTEAHPKYYFLNENNDFIGDLTVDRSKARSLTLFVGNGSEVAAKDSMLGDASNEIILVNGATLAYYGATKDETPVCARHVKGEGVIAAYYYYDPWNSPKIGVKLGETARLVPCGADEGEFGTLKVDATSIEDTAETVYEIRVDADDASTSSRIEFASESALALNGRFAIIPDDPSAKIAAGTRWTIGTVAASAGSFDLLQKRCPGYRIFAEGDAESGWTIFAEKKPDGLTVIIR